MGEADTQLGFITVRLYNDDGSIKYEETVKNLITDVGDYYQANRIAAAISGNGVSQPTLVTGMKLGTSTAAPTKNGSGAVINTYLTGSNKLFDATFPQIVNLGAGSGVNVSYKCTWTSGVATSVSINEIVLVTDAVTDAASPAASTIARALFTITISKGASETLEVTWNHRQLGT